MRLQPMTGTSRRTLAWDPEVSAGEAIAALTSGTASWQQAHQLLARFGLEIAQRGAGLAVRDRESGVSIRASQVDRQLSWKTLTERWGTFEPPGPELQAVTPRIRYQRAAASSRPDSAALHARYQRERETALEARKAARAALEAEIHQEVERL